MNILILTAAYGPRGPGAAARRLARALAAEGFGVGVLSLTAPEGVDDGVEAHAVPEYPPMMSPDEPLSWSLSRNAAMLGAASALVRARDIDVVHAFGWEISWAAAALSRAHDVPLVVTQGRIRPDAHIDAGARARFEEASRWLREEAAAAVAEVAPERVRTATARRATVQRVESAYRAARSRSPQTARAPRPVTGDAEALA